MNTDDLLSYWQPLLGLQAWRITVQVVRAWDTPLRGTKGCCVRTPAILTATITLLDEQDLPPNDRPGDAEQVLVHELLHVFHFPTGDGSAEDLMLEQGVELTARALVLLRRAAPR